MSTQGGGGGGGRRCRPSEEKEKTKLRERQRRAITAKILAVLEDMGTIILGLERILMMRLQLWRGKLGARPAAGGSTTVLASLTSLPLQQNQAAFLRGISSASPIGIDDEACQMKDTIDARQVVDMPSNLQQRDFAGTPYVPVYVLLPLGVINMKCESADPGGLLKQLRVLKSINVDGVMVDC
ncbi:beta-amylase 7 [Tanacetum coccineum]